MSQISLRGMLEFTTLCGFVFAIVPAGYFVAYGMVSLVLAIWALRVTRWTIRWMLFNWMAALSSFCLVLACLDQGALLLTSGFISWSLLAGINGFLFLAEHFSCRDADYA